MNFDSLHNSVVTGVAFLLCSQAVPQFARELTGASGAGEQ